MPLDAREHSHKAQTPGYDSAVRLTSRQYEEPLANARRIADPLYRGVRFHTFGIDKTRNPDALAPLETPPSGLPKPRPQIRFADDSG